MTMINHKKSPLNKLLPSLVGSAIFTFFLALALFYIEGRFALMEWNFASVLTYLSAISLIALLILISKRNKAMKPAANTQHSSAVPKNKVNQGFIPQRWKKLILIFTMIIGSLVFLSISHYAANNITARWDVTLSKQHTLTNTTLEFISKLKEKVKITALYVGLPPKYLQDLLNEYQRLSGGLISAQIIDPIENISFAAKFGNVVNANEHKVIVQSSNGRKDVDFSDELLSEEKLTNAIARASSPPRQVYFLTGHGEYSLDNTDNAGLATFKKLLADNNITSKSLMLGITQSIPDDCSVLIIAGPRTELTEQEDTLIVDYLAAGGDALFLIEHSQVTTPDKLLTAKQLQQNPSLNSIINLWGLNINSDIVVDLANHVGDDVGSPATKNYQQHKAITADLDYTFYVRPRSIKVLEQRRPSIKLAAIASTTSKDKSWGETNRNLTIEYDIGIDTPGPVAFSYVILEEHKAKKVHSDTRIIIFTDADFLTNSYIGQYSNAQMALNTVNWLAELDYQTFISAKTIKVERLDLTSKQQRQVLVILFLGILFLFIAGIVVWLTSKQP